ncbi:hypothetical protein COL922a_008281 [Colletotrichum nupharicola]|nr:hypothetical protein COL922a_008281 [Colletotrichum nupharicola]
MDDLDILAELEEMARNSLVLGEPENAEPLPADVTHHQRDMDLEVPPEILNHVPQPPKFGKVKYLVKLENPIHSPEIVHRLGCITMPHKVKAFLVKDKEVEKTLRTYETDKYEVTRCLIEMADFGEEVRGLTFRFAGEADEAKD